MPRVDVVVPCFNYGHFLHRCTESVLTQRGVDVRVLIIDDCSTDDSADVADELARRDTRIDVSRHEVNRGHIATYNEGLLEWASGDYTVLLSADDLLAPGALARATAIMDRDPRVGMVYGWAPHFAHHDRLPRVRRRRLGTTRWSGREWIEGRCRAGHNVISSPEVVVRHRVQVEVGGYRAELPHAGDLEMWLRVAAVSDVGYVRGAPQAYYRVHRDSMQRTRFCDRIDDLVQRRDVYDTFFAHHGDVVPDARRLHRLAQRALARDALWRAYRAYDRDLVGQVPVDELVAFATTTYADVERLGEYRALRRRRRLGPRVCHRTQLFAPTAAWQRARTELWRRRWTHRGV